MLIRNRGLETRPLSICMVAYSNYVSDARLIRHAEAAARNGYVVDFITPRNRGGCRREVINSINLYRTHPTEYRGKHITGYLLSYAVFFIACFFLILRLHIKKRYRIIQVNNIPDILVFSTLIPKLMGAKIILDIHDPMPETYRARFMDSNGNTWFRLLMFQERISAAYSDRVVTVHEPLKNDILVEHGISKNKISVVTNFADGETFRVTDRYQIHENIRMIFYGTIAERFGLKGIIEALSHVRSKERFLLKILGDGDYAHSLKKLIRDLNLENSIDFENKIYPVSQLPNILSHYQLGLVSYEVCPATDYMLPVKLMELMAMGIPALTIANVPVRFYFDDSMYFSYNPNDLTTLTELVESIIENPILLLKKRDAILRNRERFLWQNESHKYLDLLASMVH